MTNLPSAASAADMRHSSEPINTLKSIYAGAKATSWDWLFGEAGEPNEHCYTPLDPDGTAIPLSADITLFDRCQHNRQRWATPGQLLCIVVIICSSMAAGAFVFALARPHSLPSSDWITCGKSVGEAVAKDCVFDIMMNGWVPQECYNHELSEQYIARHDEFRFFADHLGYQELTLDDVRKGDHMTLYTTRNHHYAHCAYIWEIQGIAIAGGLYIDEHSMNLEHTKHCAGLLLRSHQIRDEADIGNGTRVPQIVEIGFMRCRPMW